jgi:hypothetical protein
MKTKILFCEKCNIGLMVAQHSVLDGYVQVYNQILLNALLCAFFTIHDDCSTRIIDENTGYDGWVVGKNILDFTVSKELTEYLTNNDDKWFCKIIKGELFD